MMVINKKVFKILHIVFTTETTECNSVGQVFPLVSKAGGGAAAKSTFHAERNRFSMCRPC